VWLLWSECRPGVQAAGAERTCASSWTVTRAPSGG
jgi:hypothetical protein